MRITLTLLVTLALAAFSAASPAQTFPSKSIRFLVGFAPGGTPEQFQAFIEREKINWSKVVRDSGARAD